MLKNNKIQEAISNLARFCWDNLNQLIAEGFDINEDDFQHISPIPYKHIKRYGKFSFKEEIKLGENGLRDLVKPRKPQK